MFKYLFPLLLTGCSVFPSNTQNITVYSPVPETKIYINDIYAGMDKVSIDVPRDKSLKIEGINSLGKSIEFVQTVPSTYGKLDTAGTYFLFPSIGLFFPGSVELEKTNIILKNK